MVVLRSGCAFGGDFCAKQGKVATTGSSRATASFYLSLSSRVSTQLNRGSCTCTLLAAGLAFFPLLARFDEDLCGGRKRTDSCSGEAIAARQSDICSNDEGLLRRGRGRGAWVASHRHDKANNITCELASCLVPHRVADMVLTRRNPHVIFRASASPTRHTNPRFANRTTPTDGHVAGFYMQKTISWSVVNAQNGPALLGFVA